MAKTVYPLRRSPNAPGRLSSVAANDRGQLVTDDGRVVGGGGASSEWAYRMYGYGVAELGFANAFQEVIEVPFEPGQLVEVSVEMLNNLATDTGTGASHNNGNGRYALRDIRFASGSAFADDDAKAFDGVTDATFVDVARTGDYTSVDGLGPTNMINFVPAAPEATSTTGKQGYGYTPPVLLELQPRRDGRQGSVIYIQGRMGGGAAGSQHARGTDKASAVGTHTMDVPYRRRGYWYSTYDALNTLTWGNATNKASRFLPFHLRIRSAQKCYVIGNCGDSTQQGHNTPAQVLNSTHLTMQALNQSKALGASWGYVSFAEGGSVPAFFHGLLRDQLLRSKNLPDIVFVQVHSQNVSVPLTEAAPFGLAGIRADWQRVLQLIALGESLGVKIVPMTQPPTSYIQDIWLLGGANQAIATGMETRRNRLNGWIRKSGMPYLDVDQIVTGGTYANGIAFLSGYTGTGDGYHPNLASHTAVSLAQQSMIPQILGDLAAKGISGQPPAITTYAPTANGTATVFAFPHGLGAIPSDVTVTPRNALSVSQPYAVTWDINQVYITYSTAPAAGALSFLMRVAP